MADFIAPMPRQEAIQNFITAKDTLHPGLFYERFFQCWQANRHQGVEKVKPVSNALGAFCKKFQNTGKDPAFQTLLSQHHQRQKTIINTTKQHLEITCKNSGPLAMGLGYDHPSENGFLFDRNCGVPYLSGASIKGLCRAWGEKCNKKAQVEELLGPASDNRGRGPVIFLAAYPLAWPRLEVDVICNHHPQYYRKSPGKRRFLKGEFPTPMDIESPNPVFHLCLAPGSEFAFRFFAADSSITKEKLERIKNLLLEALAYYGIGAKTAVGYGIMESEEQQEPWEIEIMPGIVKTFISHSQKDISKLREFLAKSMMMGISPWLDRQHSLHRFGYSLDHTLQDAIRSDNISAVTLFLTENADQSKWVEKEIKWAKEIDKHIIPIIAADDNDIVEKLKELTGSLNPLYLDINKLDGVYSWIETILHQARVNESEEINLHLGHRENGVEPQLPAGWAEKHPTLVLRTAEHGRLEVHEWDFNSWHPQDSDEYEEYEKHIRILHQTLPNVERIRVSGFTTQGMAGLIGKYWARSSNCRKITTWNERKSEEWSVDSAHPGSDGPDKWEYLQEQSRINLGPGNNILLGHFALDDQFSAALQWVKEHGNNLDIGHAYNLLFPLDKINAANAGEIVREIAQSFSWAKKETGAKTIYWFAGLPIAVFPLVTHLAGAKGKIIFMDFSRNTGEYFQAFSLQ